MMNIVVLFGVYFEECILFSCILHMKTDLVTMPGLFFSPHYPPALHPSPIPCIAHTCTQALESRQIYGKESNDMDWHREKKDKGSVWQLQWMRTKIVSKCHLIWYSSCFTSFVDCAESTWAFGNCEQMKLVHMQYLCICLNAHTRTHAPMHIIHRSIQFTLRLLSNFVTKQNHFKFCFM